MLVLIAAIVDLALHHVIVGLILSAHGLDVVAPLLISSAFPPVEMFLSAIELMMSFVVDYARRCPAITAHQRVMADELIGQDGCAYLAAGSS